MNRQELSKLRNRLNEGKNLIKDQNDERTDSIKVYNNIYNGFRELLNDFMRTIYEVSIGDIRFDTTPNGLNKMHGHAFDVPIFIKPYFNPDNDLPGPYEYCNCDPVVSICGPRGTTHVYMHSNKDLETKTFFVNVKFYEEGSFGPGRGHVEERKKKLDLNLFVDAIFKAVLKK